MRQFVMFRLVLVLLVEIGVEIGVHQEGLNVAELCSRKIILQIGLLGHVL